MMTRNGVEGTAGATHAVEGDELVDDENDEADEMRDLDTVAGIAVVTPSGNGLVVSGDSGGGAHVDCAESEAVTDAESAGVDDNTFLPISAVPDVADEKATAVVVVLRTASADLRCV